MAPGQGNKLGKKYNAWKTAIKKKEKKKTPCLFQDHIFRLNRPRAPLSLVDTTSSATDLDGLPVYLTFNRCFYIQDSDK